MQPTHALPEAGAPLPSLTRQLEQWRQGQARSGPVNSAQRSFHRPRSQPAAPEPWGPVGTGFPHLRESSPLLPDPMPPMGSSLEAFRAPTPTLHVTGTKEAGHTALSEPRGGPTLLTPCTWEDRDRR